MLKIIRPSTLLIHLLVTLTFLTSCRPPNLESQWDRNPTLDRQQEMPGQKPAGIDFENIHDGRPEYIRNADNPDYDPNSNLWDQIFGGSSGGETSSRPSTVDIPPAPSADSIDAYDIHNGKIDVTSGLLSNNDPDMQGIRDDLQKTKDAYSQNKKLLDQRDYSKQKSQELVDALTKKKIDPFSNDLEKRFQKLNQDIDKAIADHNQSVDRIIANLPTNEALPKVEGYEFRTPANSVNGQKVRSAQEYVNYAKNVLAKSDGVAGERGRALADYAQGAVIAADGYYSEGKQAEGGFALTIAKTALDVGLGFIPGVGLAKDVYEAALGKNLVTGEPLTKFERTMAVVGILTAGYGSKLAVAAKAGAVLGVFKAGIKEAEVAGEVVEAVSKAERFVESASSLKRFGPLEEGPLHLIQKGEKTVADTFRSGSYYEIVTNSDTKLYRVYDGVNAPEIGGYWSTIKPTGPLQAQLDAAILPEWGNKITKWVEITVPEGTTIYRGSAAPQALTEAGSKFKVGELLGGGDQVFIADKISKEWPKVNGVF